MEQMMKCPLCGTENIRTYYSEDVGLVEDHYVCMHCGYTEEMAYSPVYVGIDTSVADDGVWPSPKRMWELAHAEKDGRLVVLPCKVGDTVWIIDGYNSEEEPYVEEHTVNGMTVATDHELYFFMNECLGQHLEPFIENDIGKTVFMTREEAEAALCDGKEVQG